MLYPAGRLKIDLNLIRKNIIEDDLIEGIVALPTQLFYSVTIPVTLWFISKNKNFLLDLGQASRL